MTTNNWDEILNSSSDTEKKVTDWNKELNVPTEKKKQSLAEIVSQIAQIVPNMPGQIAGQLGQVAQDVPAQLQDLLTTPARILGAPAPELQSKLATETIPYIAEKADQPLPITLPTMYDVKHNLAEFGKTIPAGLGGEQNTYQPKYSSTTTTGVNGDISALGLVALGLGAKQAINSVTAANEANAYNRAITRQALGKNLKATQEAEQLFVDRVAGKVPWPAGQEPIDVGAAPVATPKPLVPELVNQRGSVVIPGGNKPAPSKFPLVDKFNQPIQKWSYHSETGEVRLVIGGGQHGTVLPGGLEYDKYVRGFTDLPNKTIGTRVWGSSDPYVEHDKAASFENQYNAALAFAKDHPDTEYWIKDVANNDLPIGESFNSSTFPQNRKIPINDKLGIAFEYITPKDINLNYEQKLNLSNHINNALYDKNGNYKIFNAVGITGKVEHPFAGAWEKKLSPGARATIYGENKFFSGFTPENKVHQAANALGYVLRQDAIATIKPAKDIKIIDNKSLTPKEIKQGLHNAIRVESPRDLTSIELNTLSKKLFDKKILGFSTGPNGVAYIDYFNKLTKSELRDIFDLAIKETISDEIGIKAHEYKDFGKLIEGGTNGNSYMESFTKGSLEQKSLDNLRMEVDKARDRFYKSGTGLAPTADKPHFGQVSQETKVKTTKGKTITFKKGETLASYFKGKSILVKDGDQGLVTPKEFGKLAQYVDFNAAPQAGTKAYKPEPGENPELKQSYINLSKYPKDVQAAIKKIISNQPESIQRKVVTHAEIEKMAQTLNDTPIIRNLLKLPEGQLAAEWLKLKQGEVSLVREALKSDLGEFKQKMLDILKVKQLSMAGKTGTEIGRALGSGNINIQEQLGLATEINNKIDQIKKDPTITPDEKQGYIENLVALRKLTLSKEFNPTWFDKGYEFWVNNILSGPWTHTVNVVSNTMFAGIKPLEKAVYAMVDLPMSWWTGKRTHTLSEVTAQTQGIGKTFSKEKLPTPIAEGSKIENSNRPGAIKGLKGKIIRGEAWLKLPNGKMISTNLGTAQLRNEDNYSKKLIGWMELSGKAEMIAKSEGLTGNALTQRKNELLFNPTGEMKDSVLQEQLYRTFQDATFLGEWAKKLPQFGLRWVIPFRNTPASILTKAFERTPFGWGKVGMKFGRQFVGKKQSYTQGEASADIGNALIGTSIFFALLYAYKKGRVTGSAPKKGPARDKFYAEGKQPNSILVGDKWIPYDRLEPYGTAAQYMVNTIQMFDNSEKEATFDKVLESAYGLSTSVADKTFLSGMTSAVNAVVDPQRYGEQFAAKLAGGMVPQAGLLSNITQVSDLRVRDPGNLAERVASNIPGLSQNITQKRNALGENQFREPLGATRFTPYKITQAKESTDLQKELNRLDINLSTIPKSYRTLKLSPKEVNMVSKVEGGLIKEQLTNMIANPDYQVLSDVDKQKQIDRVINNTKHEVRGVFLQDKIIGDLKKQLAGKTPEQKDIIKERYFNKLEKAKLIPKKVEEVPAAATTNNWDEILK